MSGARRAAIILVGTLAAAAPARAGWIMKAVTRTEGAVGPATEQTLYIAGGRIKELHADGTYYLWDVRRGTLFQVDPSSRSYSGGKIEDMVSGVQKYLEEMRDQLARMSPEERQALARRMPGMPMPVPPPEKPPKWAIEKTERNATIAGRKARLYEIRREGVLYEERWISSDVGFGDDLDYPTYMRSSRALERAFTEGMGDTAPPSEETRKLYEAGVELKSVLHGEKVRVVKEVTKLERADLPESTFTLPVDYTLKGVQPS